MKRKKYWGYGVATIADAAPYSFVTVYSIVFFTTVAGLSAETAGMISAVTIILNGIAEMSLGYVSDNWNSKYGRRRPFLIFAVLPLGLGLIVLFTDLAWSGTLKVAVYIAAGFLFWIGFGAYYTPYSALGAEIAPGYNERSVLRTCARVFGIMGNVLGMVLPLAMVKLLEGFGMSDKSAWFSVALLIAVIACGSILITWNSTRGLERPADESDAREKAGLLQLLRDYIRILRLKPFIYLILVIFAFVVANTFYSSNIVFFARYKLGLGDQVTSTIFLISMIVNAVCTPLLGWASIKIEKKNALALALLVSGIGAIVFRCLDVSSYLGLIAYACVFSIAYAAFWQLFNAVLYDISEVGEFVMGKRVEGSVISVYGIAFSLSMSISSKVLGSMLEWGGYDGALAVQSARAVTTIENAFMLIPAAALLIAAIFQFIYPLNKGRFELLEDALYQKRRGLPYNTEGLEKIIRK
ncbi:MFS transporter [Anaerovorax odorimutans]|uniref:MFS transporter n=1 Tax=Anaerovorax odorimutans TaxID=109327 RepID=A0ABT1RU24_9FIRM|nr:MFS transporter [Anaerovorax odorimutans]MCQ4638336.1 MFS transporter [Anaerovorax odorimutans]